MLNHLIATIMICMGVANTTPISNYNQEKSNLVLTTPKKSNQVNNYEINIQATNLAYTSTSILGTGNTYYPNGNIDEYKWNLNNGNNYINILGNIYYTTYTKKITTDDNQEIWMKFIDNVNYIDTVGLRSCVSYMLKLTPYNYNIDTESTIKLNAHIQTYTDENDIDFYAYELYYYRYIYYTSSENWDEFVNRQIAIETTNTIKQEIENINTGFFYTLRTDLIQIGQNEIWGGVYTDVMDLQITPNTNNYYFIIYRPCCRFVYQTTEQTQPMTWNYTPLTNDALKITGTNIIPDATYEIVDIPGLMFEILGMPFAFVSQAFNLTLFPGTPYQINIANLFLSIIAIFVFVWLLLLFIKMKTGG